MNCPNCNSSEWEWEATATVVHTLSEGKLRKAVFDYSDDTLTCSVCGYALHEDEDNEELYDEVISKLEI